LLLTQTTFIQFFQTNPVAQNFSYTQNGASASFHTVAGGAPVLVKLDTLIVRGLQTPQFAHLFLTSTTTSPVEVGAGGTLFEHFPAATNTMRFVLDTPVNGMSNLLSVTYSDMLSGLPNAQAGDLGGSTLLVPPDTVTFSSDFIDFSAVTERGFSLGFSSIVPGLSVGSGGFFVPFTAAGTGTFAANFLPGGAIQGQKFQDSNANGIHNPGEPGLAGWTIDLVDPFTGQVLQRTVTNGQGNYSFTGLPAGTYRIREEEQPGWAQTTANPADITLMAGDDMTGIDFGNFHPALISGRKFLDAAGTGIEVPSDLGLPNWTIQLLDPNTQAVLRTTTTDPHGDYSFTNLIPGNYRVREVGEAGYVQTTPNPADIGLAFGATVAGIDFGNALSLPLSKSQLISSDPPGVEDVMLANQVGFVTGVYQSLLNRNPDLAGLECWMQALEAGVSRQQVVSMIWNSPEHFGLEVDRFYALYLNRAADAAGRARWVSALVAGATETDVEATILGSAEFTALHGSNTAFLSALYADVLHRAPDAAGESGWLLRLQNGMIRSAAAATFLNSAEANSELIAQDYAMFLKRQPDAAGENSWLARDPPSQSFAGVLSLGILGSDEFFARFRPG
jgi:hypothetical protein